MMDDETTKQPMSGPPRPGRRAVIGAAAAAAAGVFVGRVTAAPATAGSRPGTIVDPVVAGSTSPGPTSPGMPPVGRRPTRTSPNPYLSGNFAPVPFETTTVALPMAGTLPADLAGTLFRVGPNPVAADPATHHWFVGDGMVHSFEIGDGSVRYRSRWVRTDAWSEAIGEPIVPGQPPDPYPIPNGANTNVVTHAGRLLTMYEVGLPTEIRPDLSTVGRFDFGGTRTVPVTAHPKIDGVTGEMVGFGIDLISQPHLHYFVVGADGAVTTTREIELPQPSMMHDFAITERFAVFMDVPVIFRPVELADRPIPAVWDDDHETRLGVMRRDGTGDVRWFGIEPGYLSHVLNAYEDGDVITLDAIRHTRFFDADIYGVAEGTLSLDRWTIDLASGSVGHVVLDDRSQEMPRINDQLIGRRHRFGYTILTHQPDGEVTLGGLVKHDLDGGTQQKAGLPDTWQSDEPVFVPRPSATAEDDGWILAVVYDPAADLSHLVVLDAQDFTGPAVATIDLPVRVPHHFHGTFQSRRR